MSIIRHTYLSCTLVDCFWVVCISPGCVHPTLKNMGLFHDFYLYEDESKTKKKKIENKKHFTTHGY